MSAACPVRAKGFFFLPSVSHLCWFKFWSSWSLCVVFRRKWSRESRGRLGSVLPWRRSKCSELQSACARGRGAEMGGAVPAGPGNRGEPCWGKGAWCCLLTSSASPTPFVPVSYSFLGSGFPSLLPAGSVSWRCQEMEPGGAGGPSPLEAGKVPGSLGGPAPHQSCLGLNFVLVLKTNVLFSVIFSASESSVWGPT